MKSEAELPEIAPADAGVEVEADAVEDPGPAARRERIAQVESRFLYVDVAAQRAKQLRRGALPRLAALAANPETGERPVPTVKLERIAMQEVDEGLIVYELPDSQPATEDPA